MTRFIFLLLFQLISADFILAQSSDTSGPLDSLHTVVTGKQADTVLNNVPARTDSVSRRPPHSISWNTAASKYPGPAFSREAFEQNRFFGFGVPSVIGIARKKAVNGKDLLFYAIIALLLLFAFIRVSFSKYVVDLFRVAFRTTLKQRQIGEQLIQTPLPSLLLNFFFVLTTGLYIDFVLHHYRLAAQFDFWLLYFYCVVLLTFIYILKFVSLKFFGWLFNISASTDSYIFIVFMINKIIGIYILPFLILLAFSESTLYQAAFVLSYIGVFALLAYRYILSYGLIQNQMRVNPFHFFLYLCAFEIVPLLLIYKALLRWF